MKTCPSCGSNDYNTPLMGCNNCGVTDEAIVRFKLNTRKGRLRWSRSQWVRKSTHNRKRVKHGRIGVVANVTHGKRVKRVRPRAKRLHHSHQVATRA